MSNISTARARRLLAEIRRELGGADPGHLSEDDLFRQALFKRVESNSGEPQFLIDVFYTSLANAVAQGRPDARRLLDLISQHRGATKGKGMPRWLAERFELGRQFQRWGMLLYGHVYLTQFPSIAAAAEQIHGRSVCIPEPYGLDLCPAISAAEKLLQRKLKQSPSPKEEYEVGRGKPPSESRFTSENNPAHWRKRQAQNQWSSLDRSLEQRAITTKSNGEKVQSTKAAVSYEQLIKRAINGELSARAEVVKRIIDLDRRGILAPPEPIRRAKRTPLPEAVSRKLAEVLPLVASKLRQDMLYRVQRQNGGSAELKDYEHIAALEAEALSKQRRRKKPARKTTKAETSNGNTAQAAKRQPVDQGGARQKRRRATSESEPSSSSRRKRRPTQRPPA